MNTTCKEYKCAVSTRNNFTSYKNSLTYVDCLILQQFQITTPVSFNKKSFSILFRQQLFYRLFPMYFIVSLHLFSPILILIQKCQFAITSSLLQVIIFDSEIGKGAEQIVNIHSDVFGVFYFFPFKYFPGRKIVLRCRV